MPEPIISRCPFGFSFFSVPPHHRLVDDHAGGPPPSRSVKTRPLTTGILKISKKRQVCVRVSKIRMHEVMELKSVGHHKPSASQVREVG